MAYSNQQNESMLPFCPSAHASFLILFVPRGGGSMSAKAALQNAFVATFENNKWPLTDCIHCSHNLM